MQKQSFCIVLVMIVSVFSLGACGSSAGKATPTATPLSVEAIYTAAAQTVIAQLTQQAPTITPTAVVTDTPVWTATATRPFPTLAAPTAANCARATFIDDVTIPDGTRMSEGQTFTKTWSVQNSGTCTWTTSFKLVFSYGELMGGSTVNMPNSVAVGNNVDISVKLTAPNKTGKLTGFWALVDDKGQPFGTLLTVVINVGALSPTPTGSATITPTKTPTPEPSKTPTITNTPEPSLTPTL